MAETGQVVEAGQFTRRAVEAISERHDEPKWVRDARLRAFETFERLPWPTTREEKWRRTDLKDLHSETLAPFASAPQHTVPAVAGEAIKNAGARGGAVVQWNSETVASDLVPELASRGVVLTDVHAALKDHPGLFHDHFMQSVRSDESKFTALHSALWSGGTFVYVPDRVEVELPLLSYTWVDAEGLAIFPHTIVIAGEGSRVTVVDGFSSLTGRSQFLAVPVVELILGDGAQVRFVTAQDWGRNAWEIGMIRSSLSRDSTLNSLLVGLGGAVVRTDVESVLRGPGASSEMLGLIFGDGRQRYEVQTLQEHAAPHTTSDLLYKNAVKDWASSVFIGMIRVHPGAQKTNAFQVNRNLMLSDSSRAISDPKLEIMANDLRCTHGSATSRLNEEHLFYLMSRGLTRQGAIRMVVEGFFAELLDRVPMEWLTTRLQSVIAAKMMHEQEPEASSKRQ
ncbi:MAG TPA: Fe-S cluster assembly protein SufD [bacterium]|nr:Fe-S cluster assembly protein SufD [bacterium]